ncbi:MAG: MotA/TolQ/ExbB proton channel family protein [Verrucomicrobiota bacterium]|jgi:biopolymer transport protein ExbB
MPLANVLVETFLKGGPIMWPILVCLIVALATVAERLLYWRNVRRLRADKAFSEALWEVRLGQYGPAWQRTQGAASPFLVALRSGLANGRTEPVTAMQLRAEETLEEAGARQWLLSTIVTLAPLLGLLGTVVGIMGSFQFIGSEQLAVAKVSGGVGEALIATAAGLGIAIFCLIPHNFFHRRAQSLRHDLEQAINQAEIALKSAAAAGQPVSEFQPAPDEAGRRR